MTVFWLQLSKKMYKQQQINISVILFLFFTWYFLLPLTFESSFCCPCGFFRAETNHHCFKESSCFSFSEKIDIRPEGNAVVEDSNMVEAAGMDSTLAAALVASDRFVVALWNDLSY